jgi:hypothetical protein
MALRLSHARSLPALVLMLGAFAATFVDCKGAASCDAVCDNVLDKCFDDSFGFVNEDTARNDCMEQCAQRADAVPEKCADERDAVLECLALAESIDCGDPQRSAACSDENEALGACAASGGGGGTGSGTTGSGGTGQACQTDDDCATGLCNWQLEQCSTPGAIGGPCTRDDECTSALCNWSTEVCAAPGPTGTPCIRDEECTSGQCPNESCL